MTRPMQSILIANRGEIACRVIEACRGLGLRAIAVHSDADAEARHVRMADHAVHIGPSRVDRSYLDMEAVLGAARSTGAHAIHPGYGLLSENAGFARAVANAGLVWIGPKPETIEAMGDKGEARAIAEAAGVPVLPGSRRFTTIDDDELITVAETIGYPLLVKAAGGGGGIGMRRVDGPDDLASVVRTTSELADRAFGDATVYLERFVPRARHVEVQVFGFGDGRAVHLFERECSIQRRFQKVIEESPSPAVTKTIRDRMTSAAVALAENQSYAGAGTVEFILDDDTGAFFFLEMNTRIQVEHPVTEMVTGIDLVRLQIRLAGGVPLDLAQDDIRCRGHAIECRIYAENPARNFLPSPGKLDIARFPAPTDEIRIDTGFDQGDRITPFYDPLIAKLVVWGDSRDAAIARARTALTDTHIDGVTTNLALLRTVLDNPAFRAGETFTDFLDRHKADLLEPA